MRWYLVLLLATAAIIHAQSETPLIPGTWRGESTCVAKNTACRDETVLYRWSAITAKPGWYSASADKIVDGKPINMGSLEFRYDSVAHVLTCQYAQGTWSLTLDGSSMEGTLTLPDNTVFRHVILRRQN